VQHLPQFVHGDPGGNFGFSVMGCIWPREKKTGRGKPRPVSPAIVSGWRKPCRDGLPAARL